MVIHDLDLFGIPIAPQKTDPRISVKHRKLNPKLHIFWDFLSQRSAVSSG